VRLDRAAEFFAFARERHQIYLRRAAGSPPPWTQDPILRAHKFTNVFREHDRTTVWFRTHVREPLRAKPEVLLATVLFRWFNSIRTGETLFCQADMLTGRTPFEDYVDVRDLCALRPHLRRQGPPWLSPAYMIRSENGHDKLDGVLNFFHRFATSGDPEDDQLSWLNMAEEMLARPEKYTLKYVWEWLRQFDGLGPFMAYEIVTDLRHTDLLYQAPDINTWANPGPGARRGVARLMRGGTRVSKKGRVHQIKAPVPMCEDVMRQLLTCSRDPYHWPADWPRWEMREVEHTLCEWDKYERVRTGLGVPKQRFRGNQEETRI
jgi:hypothetical protein